MNKQSLQHLIELQEIDQKIHVLENEKQSKPLRLKEPQDLITVQKQSIEDINDEIKNTKITVDEKDLSLKEKEEKIKQFNTQLNTAQTNKEYSILLTEINNIKADIAGLEDETLKLFPKIEILQERLKNTSAEITRAETELKRTEFEVKKELETINQTLISHYEIRNALVEKVPSEVISTYEKIIAHKPDKIALASVDTEEAVCQGCFMDLTSQELNELLKGTEIVRCRSCSRILYLKPAK